MSDTAERVTIIGGVLAIVAAVVAGLRLTWGKLDAWLVQQHRSYGERAFAAELARGARHEKELEAMSSLQARTFEKLTDIETNNELRGGTSRAGDPNAQ